MRPSGIGAECSDAEMASCARGDGTALERIALRSCAVRRGVGSEVHGLARKWWCLVCCRVFVDLGVEDVSAGEVAQPSGWRLRRSREAGRVSRPGHGWSPTSRGVDVLSVSWANRSRAGVTMGSDL